MATLFVRFINGKSSMDVEPADAVWTTITQKSIHAYEVRRLFGDSSVIIVEDLAYGAFDTVAMEKYFQMPRITGYVLPKVKAVPHYPQLKQNFIQLKKGDLALFVYQRSVSTVFGERAEKFKPEELKPEDFFEFRLYSVKEETIPDWGRAFIKKHKPNETIVSGVKVSENVYAILSEKALEPRWDWDDEPWTDAYIRLVKSDGNIILIYSNCYKTWDGECVSSIRLSRSGKSIVVCAYDEDLDNEVIPLSKYL